MSEVCVCVYCTLLPDVMTVLNLYKEIVILINGRGNALREPTVCAVLTEDSELLTYIYKYQLFNKK